MQPKDCMHKHKADLAIYYPVALSVLPTNVTESWFNRSIVGNSGEAAEGNANGGGELDVFGRWPRWELS